MPLNFPNTWGIKKSWSLPERQQSQSKHKSNPNVRYVGGHKEIKCPSCERWVRYFKFVADAREFGTINAHMDTTTDETESCDIFEITCPECEECVFNGSYRAMEDYVEEGEE